MWNTIYYIFGASALSTIGYGLLYYFDRPTANQITTEITWNTVRFYHKINLEYSNIKRLYCSNTVNKESKSDDENEDDDDDVDDNKYNLEFLGYNIGNNHITQYSSFNIENNNYINETEFDLMFLKKNENNEVLYKRIKNKEIINKDIEIHKIEKPFIQVELSLNNNDEDTMSIHKNLIPFYINNNDILDKTFLRWYAKTFYDITIDENYKLSIIDSDINMFNIEKDHFLRLKDKKSKYELISS